GGVVPNPRLSLVNEGIKICKEEKIEFILAIGGGSVIDSSKAIALGTVYDGNVWDFFTGKNTPKSSLGVGVVLTIPGSGSEMSESSIITDELNELKCVCDTEKNFPKFSILDPEVCFSIPDSLMGAGVADILSHLMERYFSQSIHTELSDSLMEAAMRTVIKFGPKIMKNRKDYNNCAQIMWAATVAHNGMIACGRVADWSSHRIEHEISGIYDITHGAGMAIIFPTWIDYVKDDNIEVMNRFSKEVFGVNTISEGIKELKKFFKELGLKEKLSDFNITNEKFELMAEKALAGSETLGRFKKLSKEDLIKIMEISK
ncbi:MAG: iron-containing alcohol dehydrogenase, partial [Fusobacterium sp.]